MVVAVTGGGSGALSALLQTPGASRSVLEAVVPYSFAALVDWIGGRPEQACSEPTARAMAMAAFMRARKLAPETDADKLVGIGATASLTTDRPKRGQRRIYAAFQTADQTHSFSLILGNENPSREQDEEVAAKVLLGTLAVASEVHARNLFDLLPVGPHGQNLSSAQAKVGEHVSGLLLGRHPKLVLVPICVTGNPNDAVVDPTVIFPGAFNPLHDGHRRMANVAEESLGQPLAWELSIGNVDKPPLDFIELNKRVDALQAERDGRLIVATNAPTFQEKAKLFAGATFVVGADTIQRIAETRYYGDDTAKRDEAIAEIASRGCRFLVFGRDLDGRFLTLSDLTLPEVLRRLCDEVPAEEFREDISSTDLRRGAGNT